MSRTTFLDPEEPEFPFWMHEPLDDLLEWETEQVFQDHEGEDEYEDDIDPDLYDQYEYMLDHQDEE
jgi:hypothetical protein